MNAEETRRVGESDAYKNMLARALTKLQNEEHSWRGKVLVTARERGQILNGAGMLDTAHGKDVLDELGDVYIERGILNAADFSAVVEARAAVPEIAAKIEQLEVEVWENCVGAFFVPDPMGWGEIQEQVEQLVSTLNEVDELLDEVDSELDKMEAIQARTIEIMDALQEVQFALECIKFAEDPMQIYTYAVIVFTNWEEILSFALLSKTYLTYICKYAQSTSMPLWIEQLHEQIFNIKLPGII